MKKNVQQGLFWLCVVGLLLLTSWYNISAFARPNRQSDFVTTNGTGLMLRGQLYTLNGVNYYPKDTPWEKFWANYNGDVTDKDFWLLNKMLVNSVRIFLPFDEFGGGQIGNNHISQPTSISYIVSRPLDRVADLLRRARNHNLHIIVTLFDFHTDYSQRHWSQCDQYLKTILTRFRADSTVLAWDLKNEPDLDYPASGKVLVDSWLTHISHLAHSYAPQHLLTIGWSNATAAQTRIAGVSFVSFHYYLSVAGLPSIYAALHAAIPDLPIVMTEFGMPTAGGQHTEAEQTQYYAGIFTFWRTTQSPGTFYWTLYDFSYIPHLFGDDPQQIEAQKHFGLIRADGTLKPAAFLVASNSRYSDLSTQSTLFS